jgi:hypothetical protein
MVEPQEKSELNAALFKRRKHLDHLWLLFFGNVRRTYPDTGESGDAYDAEAFLDG